MVPNTYDFFFKQIGQNRSYFHCVHNFQRAEAISKSKRAFSSDLARNHSCFHIKQEVMASTSRSVRKHKKGSEMLVKGVEWRAPNFKLVLAIAEALDSQGAQSQIPPKVLLINDIRTHFKCSIQEIGTLEMQNALAELSSNGTLKPEH